MQQTDQPQISALHQCGKRILARWCCSDLQRHKLMKTQQ
jgi:hypothetical protein